MYCACGSLFTPRVTLEIQQEEQQQQQQEEKGYLKVMADPSDLGHGKKYEFCGTIGTPFLQHCGQAGRKVSMTYNAALINDHVPILWLHKSCCTAKWYVDYFTTTKICFG